MVPLFDKAYILAKIVVYQFIYFGVSFNLSRIKALDEDNVAKKDEMEFALEFLGIFAMNVSWIIGICRTFRKSDD